MEGLAPPHELVLMVRSSIECGDSIKIGILKYGSQSQDPFAKDVMKWLFMVEKGGSINDILVEQKSVYRRALLEVLHQGLSGVSILGTLKELELEIQEAVQIEIQRHIQLLPIKMLIPLLLFQFPAYMILIFVPLLKKFLGAL